MDEIPCDKCDGKGKLPLPQGLAKVLRLVRAHYQTAEDINAKLSHEDVTVNAINGRLEKLRGFGLVKRHREGKFYHYSAVKASQR